MTSGYTIVTCARIVITTYSTALYVGLLRWVECYLIRIYHSGAIQNATKSLSRPTNFKFVFNSSWIKRFKKGTYYRGNFIVFWLDSFLLMQFVVPVLNITILSNNDGHGPRCNAWMGQFRFMCERSAVFACVSFNLLTNNWVLCSL